MMSPNLIVVFLCMVVASILTSICHYGRKRFQRGRHVNGGLARDMEAENIDGPEHHRPHAFRSYIVQHEAPGYTGRVRIWRQLPDRNALELSTITDNPEAELQQFFRVRMDFARDEIFGRECGSHRALASTPPPMPNVPPPRTDPDEKAEADVLDRLRAARTGKGVMKRPTPPTPVVRRVGGRRMIYRRG